MTKQGLLATLVAGVASLLLLSTATAAPPPNVGPGNSGGASSAGAVTGLELAAARSQASCVGGPSVCSSGEPVVVDALVVVQSAVIDFEGLAEGSIVSLLSSGNGISGDLIAGTIDVFGDRNPSGGGNDAMIFDATCAGGPASNCTGDPDEDLFQPAQGNVLIITQDNDAGDPDDAWEGGIINFDFSDFGGGSVYIDKLTILDTDAQEQGTIYFFEGGDGGTLLRSVLIPILPVDGGIQTLVIEQDGVDFMRVDFGGSGAIDNIELEVEHRESRDGRFMTGGGNISLDGRGRNATQISTHGFILYCDGSFGNFEYNDHENGGIFHLESIASVLCVDNSFSPQPPATDFDTLTLVGEGRWNGVSGATVEFTLTDHGQPGTSDTISIVVKVGGETVSELDSEELTVGNHQAH